MGDKAYMILIFGLSAVFIRLTGAHKLISMAWKFSKEIVIGLILLCAIVLFGSFAGFWKVEDVKQAKPVTQQIVADSIKSTGEFLTKQAKNIAPVNPDPKGLEAIKASAKWVSNQVMDGLRFVGSGLANGVGQGIEKILNYAGFAAILCIFGYFVLKRLGVVGSPNEAVSLARDMADQAVSAPQPPALPRTS